MESQVRVLVARNLNTPLFEGEGPFEANMDENTGTENRVALLVATDEDTTVSALWFCIDGDYQVGTLCLQVKTREFEGWVLFLQLMFMNIHKAIMNIH